MTQPRSSEIRIWNLPGEAGGSGFGSRRESSGENFFHHPAADIRQPEVTPRVAVSELLVVHAEQREDRRVQIVDVNF